MSIQRHSIVTPEAVAVRVDIAELGSRVGAAVIDGLILGGILTALQILVGIAGTAGFLSLGGSLVPVLYAGFLLLLLFGYHPFFEEIWNGRTPGKRAFGLRVIQTDGQPVGLGPVLLRNVLRPFDVALVGIGLFLIFFTRRRQRLGDLVAGTIVVRQPKRAQPSPVPLRIPPDADLPLLDTTPLTEEEYGLMRSFLERRWQLDPAARVALGNELGNLAWSRVPGAQAYASSGWGPEVLLEAVLVTVQRRSREAEAAAAVPAREPLASPFESPSTRDL